MVVVQFDFFLSPLNCSCHCGFVHNNLQIPSPWTQLIAKKCFDPSFTIGSLHRIFSKTIYCSSHPSMHVFDLSMTLLTTTFKMLSFSSISIFQYVFAQRSALWYAMNIWLISWLQTKWNLTLGVPILLFIMPVGSNIRLMLIRGIPWLFSICPKRHWKLVCCRRRRDTSYMITVKQRR